MASRVLRSLFSKLFTANGLPIKSSAPASRAFSSASGSGSEETMTGILSRSLSLFICSATASTSGPGSVRLNITPAVLFLYHDKRRRTSLPSQASNTQNSFLSPLFICFLKVLSSSARIRTSFFSSYFYPYMSNLCFY